jgi:hypothetical protein
LKPEPQFIEWAEKLHVDVRTIRSWRKREGFPHDGTFEQVKAWADSHGLGRVGGSGGGLAELKADLMREQIKLARMKNEREAGEVVASEVVDEMFVTLAQKLDLLLRLKLEVELGQRVIGKNAAEANVEGALILDEIREVINSNIALYQNDMVARSTNSEDGQ